MSCTIKSFMKRNNLYVICYGNSKEVEKGLIKYAIQEQNKSFYRIMGKANCCIETENHLYIPVKSAMENSIQVIDKENLILLKTIPVKCFYSYGFITDDNKYLYLASFEEGVDTILDLQNEIEYPLYHFEQGIHGRSHYIGITTDNLHVFSIDNALQKIYIYQNLYPPLKVQKVITFGDENIRLMSYSSYSDHFYMNTEKTNVIYILKYINESFEIVNKVSLVSTSNTDFSGGNSISPNGKFLCITIRGKNSIQCYRVHKDGSLSYYDEIQCGQMPRDIRFVENNFYVTCTTDNRIEVYHMDKQIQKLYDIEMAAPVTFAL